VGARGRERGQAVLAGHRRRQIGGDLLGFLDAAELLLELDETLLEHAS
jgi:hypothetical protein